MTTYRYVTILTLPGVLPIFKPTSSSDIEAGMSNLVHTPAEYAEMWTSWHDNVGAPMKADYAKMVGIANEGAKELGFSDVGAMWRSGYDLSPEEFAKTTEQIGRASCRERVCRSV